jgi:1-deoxy-D-xylulose-5-phosphate reductoisomerase
VSPTADRLRVLILGSTGSIGTQALQVIAANPDRFEVVGLAAGGGAPELLARQRAETGVSNIAVADPAAAAKIGDVTHTGPDAATRLIYDTGADVVLNALVGALGLQPTLAALDTGARLALSNKESLVAGGPLVVKAARPGQIVPVDSEHSALAQCLRSGTADEVAKLVLTASGGPFRGWSAADLESVTPEQAGAHPTWSMGPMNTLNSASLVNKGLELIETHLLFGVPYERIDVVVHPQSILGLAGPGRRIGSGLRLHPGLHLGVRAARRRGVPGRRVGPPGRRDWRMPARGVQRRQRGGRRGLPGRTYRLRGDCANNR